MNIVTSNLASTNCYLHGVLENNVDFEETLDKIHDFLKPNGILYMSVTGILTRVKNRFIGANNLLDFLQNAHTYQFDLTILRYV